MIREDEINSGFDLSKYFQESIINTSLSILNPPVILSIKEIGTFVQEKRIFTLGNISCIKGKQKAKKTFLISLFTSAIVKGQDYAGVLKGSLPENKKLVIFIDTEQGQYDSHNVIRRIERMSGGRDNLIAFNFRQFNPAERCKLIEFIFEKFKDKIGFVVIDGVADLVQSINDEKEASSVGTMLMMLSMKYNCHISVVIHENKNDPSATGHIGSYILKKSEIVISVTKDKDNKDVSIVNCDMSRGRDFEPFNLSINENGYPFIGEKINSPREKNYYETESDINFDIIKTTDENPF